MVFSTCENIGGNHESLRGRLHRNGRIRPIGRLGVTFLIGRLGVKFKNFRFISSNFKPFLVSALSNVDTGFLKFHIFDEISCQIGFLVSPGLFV